MTEDLPAPSDRNFLSYDTEDGTTRVQLLVDGQTVWMPQIAIAELFETSKQNVGQHIKNILADSELSEDSVVKDYFTTAADGKKYRTKHYNLNMILAIGYRVRSSRGVQFRRWATQTLREYLVKGFVLNDDRLKAAETTFGKDYLGQEELSDLNRIVTMYLDYAEDQAKRQQPMTMAQWAGKLDAFLTFNDRDVLKNAGKVEKRSSMHWRSSSTSNTKWNSVASKQLSHRVTSTNSLTTSAS